MICYADTSALAKRYLDESGSKQVHTIMEQTEYLETSVITELELIALAERAKMSKRIDSPNYRNILSRIDRDIQNHSISLINIMLVAWKTAKRLIKQRRLRVLDAIQLASALEAQRRLGDSLFFLCADHLLLEAARLEGLTCKDMSKD